MQPETYPVVTSSNKDDTDGLSDKTEEPWTSELNDPKPTVTITVSEEETVYIEGVTVEVTENVGSVTVTILDEDLKKVVSCHIL